MSAAHALLKILKIDIEVLKGDCSQKQYSFEKGQVSVGRGPENDIVFALDSKMSRQHILFKITDKGVSVLNLSQKNSIALDGEIILEKEIFSGSTVRLGESELRIRFEKPQQSMVNNLVGGLAASIPANNQTLQRSPVTAGQGTVNSLSQQGVAKPAIQSQTFNQVPGAASTATFRPAMPNGKNNRTVFYIVIGVLLLGAYFFFQDSAKKKRKLQLRDSASIESSIRDSEDVIEKTQKDLEKNGYDTTQYKLAQEQYLRGFRDYRLGQYARAIEEFQAALSFFPTHELARKYRLLAIRKFDEQVQYNMIQGKRYYGLQNYRLCMSYYSNVIKMKKEERDPIRREALQYYRECEINRREKF